MSSIVELRVGIDCLGCQNKVKKALLKLRGVNNVEIEMQIQKVTVTGWTEQKKIVKTIKKTGLRVEPWTMAYNPQFHDFNHFYTQQKLFKYTPNPSSHRKNGKIVHERVYDPYPLVDDSDNAFTMFNDDNPSGCSIM